MNNDQLFDLLARYMEGKTSPEESVKAEKWLYLNLTSPSADEIFQRLYEDVPMVADKPGEEAVRKKLDSFIDGSSASSRQKRKRNVRTIFESLTVAALLASVILCLHYYRISNASQQWCAEYASYGQVKRIDLPDSSHIWLHSDSKIIYPKSFRGKTRHIFAYGEIYAEISHDTRRPFVVESDGAKVKVLGTTFDFSSYSDNNIVQLTLLEGKVDLDVPYDKMMRHYDLAPGDVVSFDKTNGESRQYRINPEDYISWKDKRALYFVDKSLKDIVIELQKTFNVSIIVKDSRLLTTRYLASFINDESLDAILESLNTDRTMTIRKINNTYYIYPNK